MDGTSYDHCVNARQLRKSAGCRQASISALLCAGLLLVATQTGCQIMAQAFNAARGNKIKAEYAGLEQQRVAVVCVSAGSAYGPDNSSQLITNAIRMKLAHEDLEIKFVRASEVENWLDGNWEDIDYVEIGKALKADRVLAIDLESYSLHDGSTLYKGRASYTVSVFDMHNDGQQVFSRGPRDFEFPKTHGTPTTSYSERQFESYFVHQLADDVSRFFYDSDFPETVAIDAAHFAH